VAEFEVVFRIVGKTNYSYAEVKIGSDSANDFKVALQQAPDVIAESTAYLNGTSEAEAHKLVTEQLGGNVQSVEPAEEKPWLTPPTAPVWTPPAATPAAGGWTPPVAAAQDFYTIEIPTRELDDWKVQRAALPKGVIDWNGDLKRNTIKKNADPAIIGYLRDTLKRELRG
jgi:hypothetical protein